MGKKFKNPMDESTPLEKNTDITEDSDIPTNVEELKELLEKSKAEQYKIIGESYKNQVLDMLKKYANDELKKEFENKLKKNLEKKGDELKKEFENKIEETKKSVIESLALFAAFFTFIAVNVQIFTRVNNLYSAMWFTLLLLGCLGIFAWMVHILIIKKENCIDIKFGKLHLSISGRLFLPLIFLILIFFALSHGDIKLNKDDNTISQNINNYKNLLNIPKDGTSTSTK